MKFWLKTGGLVAAVWIVVAIVIHLVNASQPTAESVTAYAQATDLGALQGTPRAKAIERMETMVNHISFEERQRIDRQGVMRRFVEQLTPGEQDAYLDATLPIGFRQLMENFNKMDPAKRKKLVDDALAHMKEQEQEGQRPPIQDNHIVQRIVDQGLKSFYRDANADVKMDLAPLIEQMQRNLEH